MPLKGDLFNLFAGGFSIALVLSQLLNLKINSANNVAKLTTLFWMAYIFIQVVKSWNSQESIVVPYYAYAHSVSTLFYNFATAGIFYISLLRAVAMQTSSRNKQLGRYIGYAFIFIYTAIRTARSVLVFIQSSGSSNFPAAATMQLVTILPYLILKGIMDVYAFYVLFDMVVRGSQDVGKRETFLRIILSLAFEISMGIVALTIASLEAAAFTGNRPSVMDWIYFSWSLSMALEQKELYRRIFGTSGAGNDATGGNSVPTTSNASMPKLTSRANTSGNNLSSAI